MKQYYLGVDIGTTSTKCIVLDKEGEIISKAAIEYPVYAPRPDRREQNPEEILEAVIETIKRSIAQAGINSSEVAFVSFSSMVQSLILVDEKDNHLTQCIIWNDSRSLSYADSFKNSGKGKEIYMKTGSPTHPAVPLYKLMWLRDCEADIFEKAYKFLSIKEYIFAKFFHEYVVDYSVASATGMFNIFDLHWDKEVLEILGIDEQKLSKPVPTIHVMSGLDAKICDRTGLSKETKFVVGASDGCLANLGSNAVENGMAAVTIGTSGAVRVVVDRPVTDEKERVFCYYLSEGKYVVGGATNNGGNAYQWFLDEFGGIEKIAPSSKGLLFLPFLTGERAPHWNAKLKGSFIGISDLHERKHFARAVMEGVCFGLKEVLEAVKDLTGEVKYAYANGGFTNSEAWVQMVCDVFDVDVMVTENYESSSIGAVMLGMLAIGKVEKLEQCKSLVKESRVLETEEKSKETYKKLYEYYKESIEKLAPIMERLSEFQNSEK